MKPLDIVVFQARKVVISDNFSIASYEKCVSHFYREPFNEKKNSLNKHKHGYLIHTWSIKAFKGTVVIRALRSFHEGSIKVMPRVPLNLKGQ